MDKVLATWTPCPLSSDDVLGVPIARGVKDKCVRDYWGAKHQIHGRENTHSRTGWHYAVQKQGDGIWEKALLCNRIKLLEACDVAKEDGRDELQ